jgi:hypothetical protein
MKTTTRRWIGAAFIGAPFVAAWLLVLFHVFPETLESSQTLSSGSNIATASVYSVHIPLWLRAVFIGSIVLGLVLLLLPRREKTNA